MERYWKTRVELVFTLMEDVTCSTLAALVVKTEQLKIVFVVEVDVE